MGLPKDHARVLFCLMALLHLFALRAWCEDSVPQAERLARIDKAISRGATFLVGQQQEDGTWRSKTYGLLKDGTSLTPLVLLSLPDSDATRAARIQGYDTLVSWIDSNSTPVKVRISPQYPVYTAGLVLRIHHRQDVDPVPWQRLLVAHQLSPATGWSRTDARFGAWGYSHEPPHKPMGDAPLSPLDEPNISATVFALEALELAVNDRRMSDVRKNALSFVERCQNWSDSAPEADSKFNDGGFHFMLEDAIRNKPGIAGTDSSGQTRFHSYGSATADGLRCLIACGLKRDHPRVIAARRWLVNHHQDGAHSGAYPADRAHLQPALDYYYAASLAHALRRSRTQEEDPDAIQCAVILSSRLVSLQRNYGAWVNPAVDVREDDPLIATSFALQALQWCRTMLR